MDFRHLIQLVEDAQHERVKLYHLTNNPKFALDPDFAPEDNAFSISDRSGHKGIYLTPDIESWVNGKGYIRPFVAEILANPSALDHDQISRWGNEVFIPASQYDKLTVNRVLPLDAWAREHFGLHGWLERGHGYEFDSGEPITAKDWEFAFRGYRYPHDTRNLSPVEIKKLKQAFNAGHKAFTKYQ